MRKTLDDSAAALAMLATLYLAALASRRPEILLTPQLWAEDGHIFYQQAHELGFFQALVVPYAGYMNTFPRLIAGLALLVPMAKAPLVFTIAGLITQAMPAIYLSSARMREVAPLGVRVLVAALYLGIPNVWRVHGNMTSSQWYLALLSLLIFVGSPPRSTWATVFDVTVLALCCATGPFSILLLPIAVIVAWRRRESWVVRRSAVFAAATILSVAAMQWSGSRLHPNIAQLGASFHGLCTMVAFQIVAPVFWGENPSARLASRPELLGFLSYAGTAAGLALVLAALRRGPMAVRCFLLFVALSLTASLASPLASLKELQWVAMQRPGAVHRYWLLPELAIIVSVVTIACTARHRVTRAAGAAMIVVMAMTAAGRWRMPPLPDLRFDRSVTAFEALPVGAQMRIPILPNWTMTLTRTARD